MPRNKYPEQTVEKILQAAKQLFWQKGYDHTTLQDIIEATHLSKGAVYHHFASKEDILYHVCEEIGEQNVQPIRTLRDDARLNGLQKLQGVFRASVNGAQQSELLEIFPYFVDNPRFLASEFNGIFCEVVPDYILPMLQEGIADGSIPPMDEPEAVAEALMLLADIWLNPITQPTTKKQFLARCTVVRQWTDSLGLPLLDDALIEQLASCIRE